MHRDRGVDSTICQLFAGVVCSCGVSRPPSHSPPPNCLPHSASPTPLIRLKSPQVGRKYPARGWAHVGRDPHITPRSPWFCLPRFCHCVKHTAKYFRFDGLRLSPFRFHDFHLRVPSVAPSLFPKPLCGHGGPGASEWARVPSTPRPVTTSHFH